MQQIAQFLALGHRALPAIERCHQRPPSIEHEQRGNLRRPTEQLEQRIVGGHDPQPLGVSCDICTQHLRIAPAVILLVASVADTEHADRGVRSSECRQHLELVVAVGAP